MDFDDRARLDTSQVRDRRRAGGHGRAIGVGGGGLGIVGVIITLAVMFLGGGGDASSVFPAGPVSVDSSGTPDDPELAERCRTGADADESRDCRTVAVVNSVQEFWRGEFAAAGAPYRPSATTFFAGAVDSGCGRAPSAVGPFYCPADEGVYVDLTFFDELRSRFGARGGDFAEAYVIAHEYGHHVQHLSGTTAQVGREQGPDSDAVRLELQADCFAGLWAHHATTVPHPSTGRPLIVSLTDEDVAEGLDAAAAVGDDVIQERATGQVRPEEWTHGSAAQRRQWFRTGFDTGRLEACDTFAAR